MEDLLLGIPTVVTSIVTRVEYIFPEPLVAEALKAEGSADLMLIVGFLVGGIVGFFLGCIKNG